MTPGVAWASDAYCGPPALPDSLWTSWNADPLLIAGLLVALLGGTILASRRSGDERRRNPALLAAWLIAFTLYVSPFCAMSVALFSMRAVNHLVLVAVLAPLLAYGLGGRRLTGGLAIAGVLHTVIFWFWHAPAPYGEALSHDAIYWLMQASLLCSGVWFWRALMARWSDITATAGTLAGFAAQMGLLGALIALAPQALYEPHLATTTVWGLSALEDQQLAGLIMWVPGVLPYLAALALAVASALGLKRSADGR
ncbi:MAG: cytochrome c oxidase assembly protein [Caulobacterales bacterium]|uniref:cytochrome c oxidase assembly protein n=1 Tax=Glycocaulis sp. TaxID=1969725 RepID=UPI003F9ECF2E